MLYLPRQQVMEVVVAVCTAHGISPMETVFSLTPSRHPIQAIVTVVQESPAAPDVGVMDCIVGVMSSV